LEDDTPQSSVPASDRYVSLQDNQVVEVMDGLSAIRNGVNGDNEIDPDERDRILWEIAAFEATIVLPHVPIGLIERFVARVTKWVADMVLKTAAGEAAKGLIKLLMSVT
jgi:hypothetical protein